MLSRHTLVVISQYIQIRNHVVHGCTWLVYMLYTKTNTMLGVSYPSIKKMRKGLPWRPRQILIDRVLSHGLALARDRRRADRCVVSIPCLWEGVGAVIRALSIALTVWWVRRILWWCKNTQCVCMRVCARVCLPPCSNTRINIGEGVDWSRNLYTGSPSECLCLWVTNHQSRGLKK